MTAIKNKESRLYFYLPVSIAAFLYVLIRSFTVDITYDEVSTLKDYVPLSVLNILNYTPPEANNHILNTLLIKMCNAIFGDTVYISRLPNVISFAFFLLYSQKIIMVFLPRRMSLIAFVLLLSNPFLLDFFGLARGYGIGLAFETVSLYYLLCFVRSPSPRYSTLSLVMAALGVVANFSQLNFYLAVCGILALQLFASKSFNKSIVMYGLIVTTLLTLVIWEPLRKVRLSFGLYYGGENGFYIDTLRSVAASIAYGHETSNNVEIALISVLILFSALAMYALFQKKIFRDNNYVIPLMLIICSLSVIVQHYLLGTPYIIDRTALFLYPLIVLSFCMVAGMVEKRLIPFAVAVPVLILFVANCINHLNFDRTATWPFCSRNKEIMKMIDAEGARMDTSFIVDFSWPLGVPLRYQAEHNKFDHIRMTTDWYSEHKEPFDYYVYYGATVHKNGYAPEKEVIHQLEKDTFAAFKDLNLYIFCNFKNKETARAVAE